MLRAMAGILLEHVTKVFQGGVVAVDDVSLRIADGEFIVLVGPSGCGKSTLLRMIAGLEEVSHGCISIGERDVTDLAPRDRDVAMVFQSYALYPHMSVRQNIAYGLKVRKTAKKEIERRVSEVAAMLGLEELLDRRPAHLSGGQRQRVAMGRAIVREPAAFLMDEPLSNLDAKLRVGMRASLAQLHARLGTTTIYVTHDQTEAMTLGERVAVISEGRVLQVDSPQRLYREPADLFVAGFIGTPSMNLVEASLRGDEVAFGQFSIPLAPGRLPPGRAGSQVILGIRPESFTAASAGGHTIEITPAVVEELGSDLLVFFPVEAARVASAAAREAEEESLLPADQALFSARLDPRTEAQVGRPLQVAVDATQFHFFDPESGASLLATEPARATDDVPETLSPVGT
jgi:multiple sugar transport system ATP-binding protein